MSNIFDDADYVASRKSLLVVSCSILLFYIFDDRINSINLLGTVIDTSPDHVEIWQVLWFLLLYQPIRYFQIFDYRKILDYPLFRDKQEYYVFSISVWQRRVNIKHRAIRGAVANSR